MDSDFSLSSPFPPGVGEGDEDDEHEESELVELSEPLLSGAQSEEEEEVWANQFTPSTHLEDSGVEVA